MAGLSETVMLLGGGTASAAAASNLRHLGFDGRVILVSDEDVPPYERPPLSKEVLAGSMASDDTTIREEGWYRDNDVELVLGTRATSVDVDASAIETDRAGTIPYDHLLIATGGRARRLPGFEGERILHLRTRDDSEELASRIRDGDQAVVLGGGFIGCEVAATARWLGVEVTIIEMEDQCLRAPLGDRYGRVMTEIHRDAGCTLRLGERVKSVVKTPGGLAVTTDRGKLECEWMLVAAGMVPNTEPVHGTPIEVDGGILVDRRCRTRVPGVYAAGDVAATEQHAGGHLRVEHHDNAMRQGAVVARNILGESATDDTPHWFWSDQYDLTVQSLGHFDPYAHHVIRGSVAERSFSAFQLSGGADGDKIEAVLTIGRPRDVFAARKLMRAGTAVTAAQIEDLSTDLRRIGRPRRRR
ncbi:MAG: FAD-dependent oxidoreductase [bacterium]|nr:FAD-dependent oxidoreductase [bacterium]MDE0289159.1 FAD-dependent oxidoreductase [bacterium]MDE0377200.1 FAD-dependent oxidoreductase [bacterium]